MKRLTFVLAVTGATLLAYGLLVGAVFQTRALLEPWLTDTARTFLAGMSTGIGGTIFFRALWGLSKEIDL